MVSNFVISVTSNDRRYWSKMISWSIGGIRYAIRIGIAHEEWRVVIHIPDKRLPVERGLPQQTSPSCLSQSGGAGLGFAKGNLRPRFPVMFHSVQGCRPARSITGANSRHQNNPTDFARHFLTSAKLGR